MMSSVKVITIEFGREFDAMSMQLVNGVVVKSIRTTVNDESVFTSQSDAGWEDAECLANDIFRGCFSHTLNVLME